MAVVLLWSLASIQAAEMQLLHGHVPAAVAASKALGSLPRSTRLSLAIGLPLRNQGELDNLLRQLIDPASSNFRHFLTPAQFAERFGPSQEDYTELADFMRASGLEVTGTHPNRTILDVSGAVADVERIFHVNMMRWQHGTRGIFFAPDREPSVDAGVAILDITGLDDFVIPHPMDLKTLPLSARAPLTTGSGPSGLFIGNDFRAAYAPGVTLNGTGQSVGLFELDGFYASDVQANFKKAGLPPVPTQTVLLDGYNGTPGSGNVEVMLDIMMAAYMAPGVSSVIVYEGYNWNDVLNRMATDDLASQLSSSWCFSPTNATTEQIFKQMIAQGQSLFQASGDSGAYQGQIMPPSDDPSVTVVGGTSLTTAGAGGAWQSETTWSGSGGGVSTTWPIPGYQQGVNMSAVGGSATMRNIPDVALTADVQMFLICNNGQAIEVGGTSAAAPLWAGFLAMANQQAIANAKPVVGFLNPAIYALGSSSSLQTDLHDITTGNNGGFSALPGYDLATGWGTPAGQPLINGLTGISNPAAFSLSTSGFSLAVAAGATATSTISINSQNGFSSPVSLAVAGLPAGVTASFSPASATTTSTLTLTAGSSAATGTSTIVITGTSGSLTSSARLLLTVTGAPAFALSATPSGVSVAQGNSGSSTITVTPQNGFSGPVALAATGLPSGVTASFSPASATGSSTLTLAAISSATLGTAAVTITGSSGSISSTAALSLTVTTPPSFTLSASPVSVSLAQGATGSSTITVTPQNGFSGPVALAATGLPGGVTASFSPASTTGSSTLILTAASSATLGTSAVTITGTSGGSSSTATLSVTVAAAPAYTLSASPASVSIAAGGTGNSTITVNPQKGFSGTVALAASGLPGGVTASFSKASTTTTSTLTLTASSSATPGASTITITGSSGNTSTTVTINLTITPAPSYTLSASPASLAVSQGSTGASIITVIPQNGFSGAVALAASGLPGGVTASFSPVSATATSTVTLAAGSAATTGTYNVTIAGTSGKLSSTTTISLTVTAPASYTLSAAPSSVALTQGSPGTSVITVTPQNGFSGAVALTASGLPGGVTGSFSPASTAGTSTLTLTAASTAAIGSATVTITGTSGKLSSKTTVSLTVAAPPSFTLAAAPASLTVSQGSTGTSTITVTPQKGFSGTVALAASGLPSGVTAAFNPASTAGSSTLTLTASSTAVPGTSSVTITGTSGSLHSTTAISLTVKSTPGFTLSASPAAITLNPGGSAASTILVSGQNGFSSSVSLAASGLPAGVTATFGSSSTTAKATMTFNATSAATAGTATVTVTGTSGSLTGNVTIALTITPPPSFTLSATPASLSVSQGASGNSTIVVGAQNGFSGTVALAASGLPGGVTATFSPAGTASRSVVTFTAAGTTATGTSTVTITGTSASLTSSIALTLTVTPPPTFVLSVAPAALSIPLGTTGTSSLTLVPQNGFTGAVTIGISLPTGIAGSFAPGTTPASLVLMLSATASAVPGSSTVTITGKSGSLNQTATISLTVLPQTSGSAMVNMAPIYNVSALVADGSTFTSGGLDGGGRAYSANLLAPLENINGVAFSLGPANATSAVSNATISLPAGQFSSVRLLATGVNGNQLSQVFTVTYTDGTTTSFTQSLSDWCAPMGYPGESKAIPMSYRDNSNGTRDTRSLALYGYSFTLAGGKTVSSITLPKNRNVVVLAISLGAVANASSAVQVNLASAFDKTGITTDGRTFTGGLDGVGYAYSGTQIGTSQTYNNTAFNIGAADQADVVSGTGKTIALPAGNFSTLQMLGTGVNGNQTSQSFRVTYTDGTSATFTQSFSDWLTPQSYSGESIAVKTSYRNAGTGVKDNRTFNLYAYSFALNNSKTVSSIVMPGDANVKVLAMTLVP